MKDPASGTRKYMLGTSAGIHEAEGSRLEISSVISGLIGAAVTDQWESWNRISMQ